MDKNLRQAVHHAAARNIGNVNGKCCKEDQIERKRKTVPVFLQKTQRELDDLLHCSQQVYSNYELGQRDIPTQTLISLADFYGVSVDYLLGLTANPRRNK